jgi:hypothetical protein
MSKRPSDKDGFRAMFKFYNGMVVGQAVGRHAFSPEEVWLQAVAQESEALLDMCLAQCQDDLNDDVARYAREHMIMLIAKAPEMRKGVRRAVEEAGGLENLTDHKEALNIGVTMGKRMMREQGGAVDPEEV